MNFQRNVWLGLLLAFPIGCTAAASAQNNSTGKSASKVKQNALPMANVENAIIWHDPGKISMLNLTLGPGGQEHFPKAPYTFLQEDMNGTNPKFDVRDAEDRKWRVKLGEEARPEVVASRLLWAVGYFANDDYLVPRAEVPGLKLSRGNLKGATEVLNVRFARKPGGKNKVGIWEWKDNQFVGTREFNGLRVMMAVLNNWDLKDENNAVFSDEKTGRPVFLVNDVGASFATNARTIKREKDKGNLQSYENSKFIVKITPDTVSFGTPAPPRGALTESGGILVRDYFRRKGLAYIGQNIPLSDAKWIGGLLGQLSHQQLTDAFRAGFDDDTAAQFVTIVEKRIAELKALQ